MKKTILSISFFLIFIYSLKAQEFFEGELNYKIEYQSSNESIPNAILEREFGKTFTAFVKEDRYAMIYHAEGKQGWMKVIVRLDEGYTYTEFEKSDTIVKTKFGKESNELIEFKRNPDDKREILGNECESITLQYRPKGSDSFFQEMRGKYYFNPKYRLNPKLYSDHTEGFWNLYVQESESISIRNEIEYFPLFKTIQEVTSIVEKKVDETIFEPNKSKAIKLE